jgi:hypothetical protein
MEERLSAELSAFKDLWEGGYYEGDPLEPRRAGSTYRGTGFVSSLHATYLACIKPHVTPTTVALEIGPGRGAWTRALLGAKEVWALDALSAEHNGIHDYLGHPRNLIYHQVTDFSCSMLPEDHFDYMFSFGCLCHVSFAGITAYAQNLLPKLRSGAHCYWMVGDFAKFNDALERIDAGSLWDNVIPATPLYAPLKWLFLRLERRHRRPRLAPRRDDQPEPGRWFDAGAARTAAMLRETGYRVLDEDVGTCPRDPIVHFQKP